jgi:hypothetical protein
VQRTPSKYPFVSPQNHFETDPILLQKTQNMGANPKDPCYVVSGNLIKYEPAFNERSTEKELTKVGVNYNLHVPTKSAFQNIRLKNLKYAKSKYLKSEQNKQESIKQHLAEGKTVQAHKQPLLSQAEALGFNTLS